MCDIGDFDISWFWTGWSVCFRNAQLRNLEFTENGAKKNVVSSVSRNMVRISEFKRERSDWFWMTGELQ